MTPRSRWPTPRRTCPNADKAVTHPEHTVDPDLEREYSPSSCIGGNYQPFIDAYAQKSLQAHADALALGARWEEVRYGAQPAQTMMLCLPKRTTRSNGRDPARPPPAPTHWGGVAQAAAGRGLLVFIHGGYWQELSAQQSLFAAAHCVRQGLAFCAINYTLAPAASVAAIASECRAALDLLATQAPHWHIDPTRIVVAGSSAGAHLAAMACLPAWRQAHAAPFHPRAAVLVSGIYDLEPLVHTTINRALGLDGVGAQAQSPLLQSLQGFPPSVVSWGEVETAAFKAQSQRFAAALSQSHTLCLTQEIAGKNHFDVALDIADPGTLLGRLTLGLLT
jgi:arylformamidase